MTTDKKSLLRLGIFDSGLGGLSLIKSLEKIYPACSFVYLADTKNVPYGEKTKDQIIAYSKQNASRLLEYSIDALVIACHTSSVYAADILRETLPVPVFDLTKATLNIIREEREVRSLALLGTQSTIASGVYQELIGKNFPSLNMIACPCPSFVSLLETHFDLSEEEKSKRVEKDLLALYQKPFDGFILGCTHFSFLKPLIEKVFPSKIFLDPADEIVREVKKFFREKRALDLSLKAETFLVTDRKELFSKRASSLLNRPLERVEKIL